MPDREHTCPVCGSHLGKIRPNFGDTFVIPEFSRQQGGMVPGGTPVDVIVCANCGYGRLLIQDVHVEDQ